MIVLVVTGIVSAISLVLCDTKASFNYDLRLPVSGRLLLAKWVPLQLKTPRIWEVVNSCFVK